MLGRGREKCGKKKQQKVPEILRNRANNRKTKMQKSERECEIEKERGGQRTCERA